MKLLDAEESQERPLEAIAAQIVDGYLEALSKGLTKPPTPLRVGMLIKSPLDGKVRRVAWMEGDKVWVVSESSSYGWLGSTADTFWEYCEEYSPKTRKEVDGKNRMVPMTDEEIDQAWSDPDWSVGDRLSQNQRHLIFEVIATGPQCVLMLQSDGRLAADSSQALAKYYRREANHKEDTW